MIDLLKILVEHAVEQFGRDRVYAFRFGASTPTVTAKDDDGTLLAEFWMSNGVIQEKKFYL